MLFSILSYRGILMGAGRLASQQNSNFKCTWPCQAWKNKRLCQPVLWALMFITTPFLSFLRTNYFLMLTPTSSEECRWPASPKLGLRGASCFDLLCTGSPAKKFLLFKMIFYNHTKLLTSVKNKPAEVINFGPPTAFPFLKSHPG